MNNESMSPQEVQSHQALQAQLDKYLVQVGAVRPQGMASPVKAPSPSSAGTTRSLPVKR